MSPPLDQLIRRVLVPDHPPAHPLRVPDWAGLAFDRNIHEDFAPSEVWDALFAAHIAKRGPQPIALVTVEDLEKGCGPVLLPPDRAEVISFLTADFRFVKDHYIACQGGDWICRLDQDVTLVVGERALVHELVATLGGIEAVCAIMEDDLGPGPDDPVGLRRYIHGLVAPLREGNGRGR